VSVGAVRDLGFTAGDSLLTRLVSAIPPPCVPPLTVPHHPRSVYAQDNSMRSVFCGFTKDTFFVAILAPPSPERRATSSEITKAKSMNGSTGV